MVQASFKPRVSNSGAGRLEPWTVLGFPSFNTTPLELNHLWWRGERTKTHRALALQALSYVGLVCLFYQMMSLYYDVWSFLPCLDVTICGHLSSFYPTCCSWASNWRTLFPQGCDTLPCLVNTNVPCSLKIHIMLVKIKHAWGSVTEIVSRCLTYDLCIVKGCVKSGLCRKMKNQAFILVQSWFSHVSRV